MPDCETGRTNNSQEADVDMTIVYAQGTFRYVYKGKYTSGKRGDEPCVVKVFKTGPVLEKEYFDKDILVVDSARNIIEKYNKANLINRKIILNIPAVWTFSAGTHKGEKCLVEPFISNWEKFNSNTGWTGQTTPWHLVMQSLSHFSYHISEGETLLCDLQGGIYSDGVTLTDPIIISVISGQYGPGDLGAKGLSSFFGRHTCNKFCRPNWRRPSDQTPYFAARMGSSLMSKAMIVPTRPSRPCLTRITE